ncbi:hypothetical protein PHSY_007050 [Pseudozyma hubeiensis SY62]|uniref:Uncharacterized protein n=1 Tax=Pseudozyma hubeiensis (strain SY62) TaxID=1305764 RepID=R9PDK3_PSEHS|nr:hypothetical protein PHSY_007050 [Pseudozyma hubeiensis SY62]GAC99449.1 hypothetical protein PHSY_007050 [Pseudozyma hubeiensis SY62]
MHLSRLSSRVCAYDFDTPTSTHPLFLVPRSICRSLNHYKTTLRIPPPDLRYPRRQHEVLARCFCSLGHARLDQRLVSRCRSTSCQATVDVVDRIHGSFSPYSQHH